MPTITAVRSLHIAAWIKQQTRAHAAPIPKLRLAAIRRLFDWLVIRQVVAVNPAASVRGPTHAIRNGQGLGAGPEEVRALLDGIDARMHAGLRDRVLIALMVFFLRQ